MRMHLKKLSLLTRQNTESIPWKNRYFRKKRQQKKRRVLLLEVAQAVAAQGVSQVQALLPAVVPLVAAVQAVRRQRLLPMKEKKRKRKR